MRPPASVPWPIVGQQRPAGQLFPDPGNQPIGQQTYHPAGLSSMPSLSQPYGYQSNPMNAIHSRHGAEAESIRTGSLPESQRPGLDRAGSSSDRHLSSHLEISGYLDPTEETQPQGPFFHNTPAHASGADFPSHARSPGTVDPGECLRR